MVLLLFCYIVFISAQLLQIADLLSFGCILCLPIHVQFATLFFGAALFWSWPTIFGLCRFLSQRDRLRIWRLYACRIFQ